MGFKLNKDIISKTIYYKLREEISNLYLEPGKSISEKEVRLI
ncbi:hypothetical protein [Clostridium sp. BL-8]|nr:hypothetical protein [Clostridium sp. BL-8]OOM76629.1 hypothetical protein CLOBL_34330 [Clostridium sp. BL-8]